MTLPPSYEDTFRRFDATAGRWTPTWNWAAFWFGFLWYLYRGIWIKALIYVVVAMILGAITGGVAGIPLWIAIGMVANYDLYLLHRKGTQLWDGGGIAPNAVPGVTNSVAVSTPAYSNARLTALDNARAQGVISEAEYASKRQQIELDAERDRKLAALDDMYRSGLISPLEYEAKKREIHMETASGAVPATS